MRDPAGAFEAESRHVLIVDDNLDYAENIAEMLQIQGCPSEICETAEEALPVALSARVTVIITDYRLPGMNGLELVRRIFRERSVVRAVLISANADDDTRDAARRLGAEFLAKPVDFAALDWVVQWNHDSAGPREVRSRPRDPRADVVLSSWDESYRPYSAKLRR